MSELPFTPGPWAVFNGHYIITADGTGRIPLSSKVVATINDVRPADALMMAAAPALFNAIYNSDNAHWTPAMRDAMKKALGE